VAMEGVLIGRPSRYPDEFRREAVQMALATRTPRAAVARRLGVNETTLRNWVHAHLAEQERGRNPRTRSPPPALINRSACPMPGEIVGYVTRQIDGWRAEKTPNRTRGNISERPVRMPASNAAVLYTATARTSAASGLAVPRPRLRDAHAGRATYIRANPVQAAYQEEA
jgi:hypothetical protein